MNKCSFIGCRNKAKHLIKSRNLESGLEYHYCDLHFAEIKLEGLIIESDPEKKDELKKEYYQLKYGRR